jgi:hypothetical protein
MSDDADDADGDNDTHAGGDSPTDIEELVEEVIDTAGEFDGIADLIERGESPMQTKPDQDDWWHPVIRVHTPKTGMFLRWILEYKHDNLFNILNDPNSDLPSQARENLSSQLRSVLDVDQRLADSHAPHNLEFKTPMELNVTIGAAMYAKRIIQDQRDNVVAPEEKIERIDIVLETLVEPHWDEDVLAHFRQIPYAEGLESN